MPRPPRLHVPGGHYHVILRGNHREPLFDSPADREALGDIVAKTIERFDARVHAFCWMTNHLHLLMQIDQRPLGKPMQRIAMRYSRYRHKALRTTGHLFERRYKAKLVDVDAYFLTLLRYIHLNPVKARIVPRPADYSWSSHRAYLGVHCVPWLTTDFGLSLFSSDLAQARIAYQQFMLEPSDDDDLEQQSHPEDPRVLGDDRFFNRLPSCPFRPRSPVTLEQLATAVCAQHTVSVNLIRSRSSSRMLTPIRLQILREAVDQRIASLTEVAHFLNREPSTLCTLALRHQRQVE